MADLTAFLSNLSEIMTAVTAWVTTMMGIFLEPPLVVFLGIGIFGSIAYLVKSLLHR